MQLVRKSKTVQQDKLRSLPTCFLANMLQDYFRNLAKHKVRQLFGMWFISRHVTQCTNNKAHKFLNAWKKYIFHLTKKYVPNVQNDCLGSTKNSNKFETNKPNQNQQIFSGATCKVWEDWGFQGSDTRPSNPKSCNQV